VEPNNLINEITVYTIYPFIRVNCKVIILDSNHTSRKKSATQWCSI